MGCRELQVNDYFIMTDSVSGTDVPHYALADANKNITEYFDTNGNGVAHYEYSPFGKITQQSGSGASDFDFRFSSEYADDETGLVYYNYRYYSPELGRWLSRDPIGEKGGLNLYGMVGNDGINGWDLWGLDLFFLFEEEIIPEPILEPDVIPDDIIIPDEPITTDIIKTGGDICKCPKTRPFKDFIDDITKNPENWEKTAEDIAKSTNSKNKGGESIEEEFTNKNTGDKIYRHTLKNKHGKIIEKLYRPYSKQLSPPQ